jgi:ubiquinol-cytochrome c reductase iron-sulfur subunit
MAESNVNTRRRLLLIATGAAGGAATVAAAAPFFVSMFPSARARAAGAPVEVDISKVEPGMMIRAEWRGKPVWILHRTPEMLEGLEAADDMVADPGSDAPMQPPYAKNEYRSIRPEWLVLVGICTHLGCSPTYRRDVGPADLGADWLGGFFCPCHQSKFDLAGRVYRGVPAPTNLVIPPHRYATETRVVIGEDPKAS